MTKIKDLVKINTEAVLDTGIQLDWYYDSTRNERLSKGYMFSYGKFSGNKISSIGILRRVQDCLLDSQKENIFTVIAGYGQGKTHFALVLANFFGRAFDDPLVEEIINSIEHSSANAEAAHFRSFKKNIKKPSLVIKIAGHLFRDLRQGFLKALREALDEHPVTKDFPIKSTITEALNWLNARSENEIEKARTFLIKEKNCEYEDIVSMLKNFDSSAEDIVTDLCDHLYQTKPDFGASVNLEEVILQIHDELCEGPEAPFNKMVIVFDELGVYLEGWQENHIKAGNLALQNILEACANRRGKISLVTFTQTDPNRFSSPSQPDFNRFTGRLRERLYLAANLELVLNSMIGKNKEHEWQSFMRLHSLKIEEAASDAYRAMPQYQEAEWEESHFREIMSKGMFPLHPLTAALLCQLDFAQGRSVINFVDEEIKRIASENASDLHKGPLWVSPVRIVDLFEENFRKQEGLAAGKATYADYENAVNQIGQNQDSGYYTILKALFLYDIGGIRKSPTEKHSTVLSKIALIPEDKVEDYLNKLANDFYVIRYVEARGEYEFSGVGTGAGNILPDLRRETAGKEVESIANELNAIEAMDILRSELPDTSAEDFKEEFNVDGSEWALCPVIHDASSLEREKTRTDIRDFAREVVLGERAKIKERGLIIYTIPRNLDEHTKAFGQAKKLLNEWTIRDPRTNRNYPFPIVFAITRSAEVLNQSLLMLQSLRSWSEERQQLYGKGYIDALRIQTDVVQETLLEILTDVEYVFPDEIEIKIEDNERKEVDIIASHLFAVCFPYRPPNESDVLRMDKTRGNTVAADIARHLIANDLNASMQSLDKVVQNAINSVLTSGSSKWDILNRSNHQLITPKNPKVAQAWKNIEAIQRDLSPRSRKKDGQTSIRIGMNFSDCVDRFKMMPYGFDDRTLTLLLSAWIGLNKTKYVFSGDLKPGRNVNRVAISSAQIQEKLDRAKDFVSWLRKGKVQCFVRGDDYTIKEVTDYLEALKSASEYEEAESLLEKSSNFKKDIPLDDPIYQEVIEAESILMANIGSIETYQNTIKEKFNSISEAQEPREVINFLNYELQPQSFGTIQVSFEKMRERCLGRLQALVHGACKYDLTESEQYFVLKDKLTGYLPMLESNNLDQLSELVQDQLPKLESEHEALKRSQMQDEIIHNIEVIQVDETTSLAECKKLEDDLNNYLQNELSDAKYQFREIAENKLEIVQDWVRKKIIWINNLPDRIVASQDDLDCLNELLEEINRRMTVYTENPTKKMLAKHKELAQRKQKQMFLSVQRRGQIDDLERELGYAERLKHLEDIETKIDDLIHEMGEAKRLDSLKGVVGEKIREANEWVDNLNQSAIIIQNESKVESWLEEINQRQQNYEDDSEKYDKIQETKLLLTKKRDAFKNITKIMSDLGDKDKCQIAIQRLIEIQNSEVRIDDYCIDYIARVKTEIQKIEEKEKRQTNRWMEPVREGLAARSLTIEKAKKIEDHLSKDRPTSLSKENKDMIRRVEESINRVFDEERIEGIILEFEKLDVELRTVCIDRLSKLV